MSLPPRFASICGLIQVATVTGGYFIVRVACRQAERYLFDPYDSLGPLPWLLRTWGLCLLLVPALWIGIWIAASARRNDPRSMGTAWCAAGIAITVAMLVIFAVGGIEPLVRAYG